MSEISSLSFDHEFLDLLATILSRVPLLICRMLYSLTYINVLLENFEYISHVLYAW